MCLFSRTSSARSFGLSPGTVKFLGVRACGVAPSLGTTKSRSSDPIVTVLFRADPSPSQYPRTYGGTGRSASGRARPGCFVTSGRLLLARLASHPVSRREKTPRLRSSLTIHSWDSSATTCCPVSAITPWTFRPRHTGDTPTTGVGCPDSSKTQSPTRRSPMRLHPLGVGMGVLTSSALPCRGGMLTIRRPFGFAISRSMAPIRKSRWRHGCHRSPTIGEMVSATCGTQRSDTR